MQKNGQKVSALARVTRFLPYHRKRDLLKAFIESQFSYCPLIWMFCSRKMNRKINHIHERALRLVYDDYNSSFEQLLIRDNSVSIHHKNIQRVAIEMYEVVNDISPPIMRDLFVKANPSVTRSTNFFVQTHTNTVFKGENSLRVFGPIVWDKMLPSNLKTCDSLNEFRNAVKTWIPNNCVCRLCRQYITDIGFV